MVENLPDLLDELADEIPIPGGAYFTGLRHRARAVAERLRGEQIQSAIHRVYAQREEILEAFIAKYKCQPDEIVQVQQQTPTGLKWWVERQAKTLQTEVSDD